MNKPKCFWMIRGPSGGMFVYRSRKIARDMRVFLLKNAISGDEFGKVTKVFMQEVK